jgi:hypothetical protein
MRIRAGCLVAAVLVGLASAAQAQGARGIASRANKSVVAITATLPNGDQQTGTGFFVKANGTLATNYHVIEGAASLAVALPDGEVFRTVYLLAADPDHDLAVLRIPLASPTLLELGSDATVEVGDHVYAMSNPLGLERTFSEGILSSKRLDRGVQLLQITAPISHGSSGGPIMDSSGRVVGIATLISREGQALNWAVPVRYLAPLIDLAGSPRVFTAALAPPRPGLGDDETTQVSPNTDASAATGLDDLMRRKVYRIIDALDSAGYSMRLTHEIGTGALRQRESRIIPVELDQGVKYTIFGTCDADCADLDIEIRQLDGRVAGKDDKPDKMPVVDLTVARAGKFNIVVTMATCTDAPCWYGVGVATQR